MLKVKKQDIAFGIRIVTYPRNGRTKDILPKTLESVLNQTYKNWIIYLTGDDYLPDKEFESFASKIPQDKIKIKNIDVGTERKSFTGLKLWYCGGIKAINYTLN